MKNIISLVVIIILAGCSKKEGLDLQFKTIYKSVPGSSKNAFQSTNQNSKTGYYTEYGDFLRTITPDKVTAKFNTIRFIDRKSTDAGMQTMLEIIGVNWPFDDERRFADFTKGNEIEVTPEIYGNVSNDGWFVDKNIRLKYLFILPQEFILEFKVPDEFTNHLTAYHSCFFEKNGNTIKCDLDFLLLYDKDKGYENGRGIGIRGFVFGETDHSYIVLQDNIPSGDVIELISQAQPFSVVRSHKYTSPTLYPPADGETKIITTTISFDSNDIIQHYAGYDNIPCTWDDIFVFVPKFWERFNVVIEQN